MSDLSDFFKLISEEKRKKKEELESLISDSFDDLFVKPLTESTSKKIEVEHTESKPKTLIEQSLGLLAEPENKKQKDDTLTPLNQNFITLEDFNKHYSQFLSRIQQQLSTLGGGGESNLTFMNVPVKTVTTSSYSLTPRDYYVGVNFAGAVTLTLPKAEREGKTFIVKDELGEASKGVNRYITILPSGSDLIDGRDRAILAYDYGSLTFIWKSNSWRVV